MSKRSSGQEPTNVVTDPRFQGASETPPEEAPEIPEPQKPFFPVFVGVLLLLFFHFGLGFGRPIWAVTNAHDGDISMVTMPTRATRFFATADDDGNVKVWDLQSKGAPVMSIPVQTGRVRSISFNELENEVGIVDSEGRYQHWSIVRQQQVASVEGEVLDALLSPDNLTVALKRPNGVIQLYRPRDNRVLHEFGGYADPEASMAFSRQGGYLAIASRPGQIDIWRLRNIANQPPERFKVIDWPGEAPSVVPQLRFSRADRYFAAMADGDTIHVWEFQSRREVICAHRATIEVPDPITSFDFAKSEDLIGVGAPNSVMRFYQSISGDFIHYRNPVGLIRNRRSNVYYEEADGSYEDFLDERDLISDLSMYSNYRVIAAGNDYVIRSVGGGN